MSRVFFRAGAALALALGVSACQEAAPTTPVTAEVKLQLAAYRISGTGESTTITLRAHDAQNKPGTGTVTLAASAGQFANNGLSELSLQLDASGQASAVYACNATLDTRCKDTVLLEASWGTGSGVIKGSATVAVTSASSTTPDAGPGTPDAGPGTPDAGPGTPDAGPEAKVLAVVASKTHLVQGLSDSATLSITGAPASTAVTVAVTGGAQVAATAAGPGAASFNVTSDAQGAAQAVLLPGTASGAVAVTVSAAGATTVTLDVVVHKVSSISYAGMKCAGSDCTVLGLQGSGLTEQGEVAFLVADERGAVVPGLSLSFALLGAPAGTTVVPSAVTDENGVAVSTLHAGTVVGATTVRAGLPALVNALGNPAPLWGASTPVGIRGGKPSNHAFVWSCPNLALDAYAAEVPPLAREMNCTVKLVDRNNNPVGTGAQVGLKTEAGTLPARVVTAVWDEGTPDAEGMGSAHFSTLGQFPPVDVTPLDAAVGQWPFDRELEPRSPPGGPFIHNPRDGFVTLLAYTRGEEYFQDDNANGVQDNSELFIDQGEAFIDSNDNGVRDVGELYIDDSPANGSYDGPNNKWDANTTIWTTTHVLYTGFIAGGALDVSTSSFKNPCPAGIPKGAKDYVGVSFYDANFNRPATISFSLAAELSGDKGSAEILSPPPDTYGFGFERRLKDATAAAACTSTSSSCVWTEYFTTWDKGSTNAAKVTGQDLPSDPANPDACVNATLTVTGTVSTPSVIVPYEKSYTGGLQ